MNPLSHWTFDAAKVGDKGRNGSFSASDEERAGLAGLLDVLSCDALAAQFTISPLSRGRFRLKGTLVAQLTQACVVTLDPMPTAVEEPFDVEFWPEAQIPVSSANESDVLTSRDPEPLVAGVIDVGRIVFEHLSAAIDPFPRKEDASLDKLLSEIEQGAPSAGPFAALARLKGGSS